MPDVAANAGGNMCYMVPGRHDGAGRRPTAPAPPTPLWAALVGQIDTIFDDQGLPQLGYMNDLLYIAAAIAPASFNDVTFGNNISSFSLGGADHQRRQGDHADRLRLLAGPGYDLTTGLGTPNGLLLARAMSAIAHAQMSFGPVPTCSSRRRAAGRAVPTRACCSRRCRPTPPPSTRPGCGTAWISAAPRRATFAWTSLLAQQSLQADFDPNLVRMFDKQAQGGLAQSVAPPATTFGVDRRRRDAHAVQGTLSTPFGFADFVSGDGAAVRVARPVAVAETAGGLTTRSPWCACGRTARTTVAQLLRVDDLDGTIDGMRPGDDGYAAAAAAGPMRRAPAARRSTVRATATTRRPRCCTSTPATSSP